MLCSNFGSKGNLFLAAFERHCDQDLAQIQTIMGSAGTLQERLEAFSGQFVELTDEHRQWWLLSVELWLHALRDPNAHARMAALGRKVRSIVADALQREAARRVGLLPGQPATSPLRRLPCGGGCCSSVSSTPWR